MTAAKSERFYKQGGKKKRGAKKGLTSLCIGGGMGIAMTLER